MSTKYKFRNHQSPSSNNVSLALQFAPSTLQNIFGSGSISLDGGENTSDVLDNTDWGTSGNTASAESMGIDITGIFIDINGGGTGFSSSIAMNEGPGGDGGSDDKGDDGNPNGAMGQKKSAALGILTGGMALSATLNADGGGPEDPVGDVVSGVVALGALTAAGTVVAYHQVVSWFAKEPINQAQPKTIESPIDPKKAIEEIPDKTNRIRPIYFNNNNYFPEGNGKNFIKWFIRLGGTGAAYKEFWYDPSHPNSR